jgi:Tol biopolymer transport system component
VLASGHLVYASGGKLYGVRFDLERRIVVGEPTPVIPDLMMGFPREPSLGHFAVAESGTLVYISGPATAGGSRWVWVDRANGRQRVGEKQKQITGARLSPDGSRMAVSAERWGESGSFLWIEDLDRGTFSRLTFEREAYWPLWSPDADRIAFTSWDGGSEFANIFQVAADGSGSPERLTAGELWRQAGSFSLDGTRLIFHRSVHPETGWDVVEVAVSGEGGERALLDSRFNELQPTLSPNGRWLAYVSNETGRNEVYVRRYPGLSDKWQISNQGGIEPAWSGAGDELFYRNGRAIMRVVIDPENLSPARPVELFEGDYQVGLPYGRSYDVAPGDQGFLFLEQPNIQETEFEVRVVLDWPQQVESTLSVGNQ